MKAMRRREDVVIEDIGRETMAYDPVTTEFHLLSDTAAFVFRRIDGRTSESEMIDASEDVLGRRLTPTEIDGAVAELARVGIVQPVDGTTGTGITRRTAVTRMAVGMLGTVPLVTSLHTPWPWQAQSCLPKPPKPPKPPCDDKWSNDSHSLFSNWNGGNDECDDDHQGDDHQGDDDHDNNHDNNNNNNNNNWNDYGGNNYGGNNYGGNNFGGNNWGH